MNEKELERVQKAGRSSIALEALEGVADKISAKNLMALTSDFREGTLTFEKSMKYAASLSAIEEIKTALKADIRSAEKIDKESLNAT